MTNFKQKLFKFKPNTKPTLLCKINKVDKNLVLLKVNLRYARKTLEVVRKKKFV